MTQALPNNSEAIERRIDRAVVGTIAIDPRKGMAVDSMGQAMEVAKLMSISDCAVPKHLRGNPGACLAVAIQGYEWSINPFAIANKSYEVNDRLVYESALYQAVVTKRAPIKGRMRYTFSGEGETRQCKVTAELSDGSGIVDYESPKFSRIQPKNSPLWKHDPDQQLIYYSVRAFARRHFADVMLGIQTVDEIQDSPPEDRERDTLPKTRAAKILEDISGARSARARRLTRTETRSMIWCAKARRSMRQREKSDPPPRRAKGRRVPLIPAPLRRRPPWPRTSNSSRR